MVPGANVCLLSYVKRHFMTQSKWMRVRRVPTRKVRCSRTPAAEFPGPAPRGGSNRRNKRAIWQHRRLEINHLCMRFQGNFSVIFPRLCLIIRQRSCLRLCLRYLRTRESPGAKSRGCISACCAWRSLAGEVTREILFFTCYGSCAEYCMIS